MGGESDYFSVVKVFQSLVSPLRHEMRLTLMLRAGRHWRSIPVFQSPHHVLSQRKKNFFPACVWRLWSLSLPQTLHKLPLFFFFLFFCFFFTKASGGLRGKSRSHQIFIWNALAPHFWGCGIARRLAKSFCGSAEAVKPSGCGGSVRHSELRFVASDEPDGLGSALFCRIVVELSSLGMKEDAGRQLYKASFLPFSRTNIPL